MKICVYAANSGTSPLNATASIASSGRQHDDARPAIREGYEQQQREHQPDESNHLFTLAGSKGKP